VLIDLLLLPEERLDLFVQLIQWIHRLYPLGYCLGVEVHTVVLKRPLGRFFWEGISVGFYRWHADLACVFPGYRVGDALEVEHVYIEKTPAVPVFVDVTVDDDWLTRIFLERASQDFLELLARFLEALGCEDPDIARNSTHYAIVRLRGTYHELCRTTLGFPFDLVIGLVVGHGEFSCPVQFVSLPGIAAVRETVLHLGAEGCHTGSHAWRGPRGIGKVLAGSDLTDL
jgi:hypothetical protein